MRFPNILRLYYFSDVVIRIPAGKTKTYVTVQMYTAYRTMHLAYLWIRHVSLHLDTHTCSFGDAFYFRIYRYMGYSGMFCSCFNHFKGHNNS